MSANTKSDAGLNFRLKSDLKRVIEEAAAQCGQTVSEFAVSTLVQTARSVLDEHERTELSRRDRDLFLAALEDADAEPNDALSAAAQQYKRQLG